MKNFFDTNDKKITEKAFSQSLIISVESILLCLVVLCSMTYAWFTDGTTSAGNTITSGSFDLDVDVSVNNGEKIDPEENDVWTYELDAGTYTVTLSLAEGSTAKGYCVVTVDGTLYLTSAISKDNNNDMTFEIDAKTSVEISFAPTWGLPADAETYESLEREDTLTVGDNYVETDES